MRSLPRTDASVQPTRAPPLRAVRALNRAYRSSDLSKGVVGAPSPSGVFHQDALSDEVLDIAQRRVLRALGEFRPFRGGELSLEAFEKTIEYQSLAGVQREIRNRFPEVAYGKHGPAEGIIPTTTRSFFVGELRVGNKTDLPSILYQLPVFTNSHVPHWLQRNQQIVTRMFALTGTHERALLC